MADTKITALSAITTVDPANDVLPIVDVSDTSMAASGTTKKITTNQILGASGTATLASATISGDLTVDTNTLKVDSANNRVGIGTATPYALAHVNGTIASANFDWTTTFTAPTVGLLATSNNSSAWIRIATLDSNPTHDPYVNFLTSGGQNWSVGIDNSDSDKFKIALSNGFTGSNEIFAVDPSAVFSWYDGAGGTRMTLNSTGLLVGASASGAGEKFNALGTIVSSGQSIGSFGFNVGGFDFNSTTKNLRIYAGTSNASGSTISLITGTSTSFVTGVTIDASGTLLVGKTGASATTIGVQAEMAGAIVSTMAASTSATNTLLVYSTGASAYRFYVGMNGTINATNTTISAISDARLKENVQDIDVGLGAILALKPRKFDWKAGKGKDIKGDRGFIAQEFEQVFPNLIDNWKDPAPEGEAPYKSVRQDLIPVLVKAIQELAAEVNALKNA